MAEYVAKKGIKSADVWEAYRQCGTVRGAARALGICQKTAKHHLNKQDPGFEVPELPSPNMSPEELWESRKAHYNRVDAAYTARKLIPVKVKLKGPIGILHFGDPHTDGDTDLAELEAHARIVRNTDGMFAGNIGDQQNNWVGRLQRLYGEQSTSARESWILTEHFLGMVKDWLYLVGGNHDCHDAQTECLTKRGWLKYSDIKHDDHVLSIITDTGKCEWTSITECKVFPHCGEMITIRSESANVKITSNHRVLIKSRSAGNKWTNLHYVDAGNISGRFALPVSATCDRPDFEISDDMISLCGWILTDGCISYDRGYPRVSIFQSKDGSEITRILNALNISYKLYERNRDIKNVCGKQLIAPPKVQREWRLNAESTREVLKWLPQKKILPEWANLLSTKQFQILLDALIAGDGCWDGADPKSKKVAVLHGESKLLDSVQALAIQHGWMGKISIARDKDHRLNLCKRDIFQLESSKNVERTEYQGVVWCLRVPHGNFMVRRNGFAHFSGNSWSGAGDPLEWILRGNAGPFEYHGCRMNLTFPNGREVRVNARHDFRGHSQWNVVHGVAKAAQMGWKDHILVCGHKHTTGYTIVKDPASELISHCIRVGTYKKHDEHARAEGFPDHNISSCCVTVIDPDATIERNLVTVFFDPEHGADYLTWRRNRK
jgi:hypothetical protein